MTAADGVLALVTLAAARHDHLRRQREWIARLDPAPDLHVVVSMGDPDIAAVLDAAPPGPTSLVELPAGESLPLAAARNTGVAEAERLGATAVALLDVDCLPEADYVADTRRALELLEAATGPSVLTGRVRYLPEGIADDEHVPERLEALGADHPARTLPERHRLSPADPELLWSLNLALTVDDWHRIGGFDERYTGYGGEDTDFGQRLRTAGGMLWWFGGAGVLHQHHPVSSPPVEHAAAIARNANLFRSLWGFDPMAGWLADLERLGRLRRDDSGEWRPIIAV